MKEDELLSVIEVINNWCKSNDIICFKGIAEEDFLMSYYNYSKESNDEWIDFLEIAKKLKVNIVVIEKVINNIKTLHENDFEIILNEEDLNPYLKKKYENALEHEDEIALIKLTFNYNDICYRFIINSEWYIDYSLALTLFENSDEVDINSSSDNVNSIFPKELYQKRLSEKEIEDYSRNIILREDFIINAKSKNSRENFSKKALKEILGDDYNESFYFYYPVVRNIEALFEIEIKPIIELEIKTKVLELKKQGYKKVEIRSKLDISRGLVDRFYDME
jgi:hypothetical protein